MLWASATTILGGCTPPSLILAARSLQSSIFKIIMAKGDAMEKVCLQSRKLRKSPCDRTLGKKACLG